MVKYNRIFENNRFTTKLYDDYNFKVVFITDSPRIGGLVWRIGYTAYHMKEKYNIDPYIIFRRKLSENNILEWLNQNYINYYICDDQNVFDKYLEEKIDIINPDMIHIGWLPGFFDKQILEKCKSVVYFAGLPANKVLLEKFDFTKKIDCIIPVSNDMTNVIDKKIIDQCNINVIENSINEDVYKIDINKEIIRNYLQIPNDKKIIIWSGRIDDFVQKRFDVFLKIVKKSYESQDNLYFIAAAAHAKKIEDIEFIDEISEYDNLKIFYNIEPWNMPYYYKASDVYLSTSDYEGLSISALEALASGLPMICSDVPGLRELVLDGKNGYKIPNRNIDEYYNKLLEITNINDYHILSNNSRILYNKKYNLEKYLNNHIELYKKISNKKIYKKDNLRYIISQIGENSFSNQYNYISHKVIKSSEIIDPDVSLIIRIFNSKNEDILRAIDSVKNNNIKYEIIVIDNCSDHIENNVLNKSDTYIKNISNYGCGISRDIAVKYATGKYIRFLDSDDYLPDNILDQQYNLLVETDSKICIGPRIHIGNNEYRMKMTDIQKHNFWDGNPKTLRKSILDSNKIFYCTSGTMIRNSDFINNTLNDFPFSWEDYIWLKQRLLCVDDKDVIYLDEPLLYYDNNRQTSVGKGYFISKNINNFILKQLDEAEYYIHNYIDIYSKIKNCRIKIVFIINHLEIGGVQSLLYNICKYLSKDIFDLNIIYMNTLVNGSKTIENIIYQHVNIFKYNGNDNDIDRDNWIKLVLKNINPDIVWYGTILFASDFVYKNYKVCKMIEEEKFIDKYIEDENGYKYIAMTDSFVSVSDYMKIKLENKINNISVIKTFVDMNQYLYNYNNRNKYRKELDINNINLCWKARLYSKDKGTELLFYILNYFKNREDVSFSICTPYYNKKIYSNLENIVKNSNNIQIFNDYNCSNMYQIDIASDAFLSTSTSEGGGPPFSVVEAMAGRSGLILSDIAGHTDDSDFISDFNVFKYNLSEIDSVDAIEKFIDFYKNDNEMYQKSIDYNKYLAMSKYSHFSAIRKWTELFYKIYTGEISR